MLDVVKGECVAANVVRGGRPEVLPLKQVGRLE
jgi:hypothetical protein